MRRRSIHEVTEEKWAFELDDAMRFAKEEAENFGISDIRWWFCDEHEPPCIYKWHDRSYDLACPFSPSVWISRKSAPPTARWQVLPEVHRLYHVSSVPCTRMNMGVTVKCLCKTGDGRKFITSHQVGKCPWKVKEED